jgi:hypothetical protein
VQNTPIIQQNIPIDELSKELIIILIAEIITAIEEIMIDAITYVLFIIYLPPEI